MSKLHTDIAKACLKDIGSEVCGFIRGSEVIPVKNIADDPATSFVIDARDYFQNILNNLQVFNQTNFARGLPDEVVANIIKKS